MGMGKSTALSGRPTKKRYSVLTTCLDTSALSEPTTTALPKSKASRLFSRKIIAAWNRRRQWSASKGFSRVLWKCSIRSCISIPFAARFREKYQSQSARQSLAGYLDFQSLMGADAPKAGIFPDLTTLRLTCYSFRWCASGARVYYPSPVRCQPCRGVLLPHDAPCVN